MNSRTVAVGTGSVRARPTTCRSTPLQDRSPSALCTTAVPGGTTVSSQAHPPAPPRHVVALTPAHHRGDAPHQRPSAPSAQDLLPGGRVKGAFGVADRGGAARPLDPPARPQKPAPIEAKGPLTRAPNTNS